MRITSPNSGYRFAEADPPIRQSRAAAPATAEVKPLPPWSFKVTRAAN
jgi:hypothetical protein